jgi:adenosine 3'-phospho 5'-phosphosulfate transporter B2
MTQKYIDSIGSVGQFTDSQFLVFVNRILAFAVALLYITFFKQPTHKAPLYKYSYCAFSNIMSSWCQYEALKFISFPTQVLAKASKIIPVMIMGWIISRKKYDKYEYVVAITISIGMGLFLSGSSVGSATADSGTSTTFSGFILLLAYMSCDAFTSNWQKELFDQYKISPVQAMCGVNFFGCLFTTVSLMQRGTFFDSLVFMSQFPNFTFDCVLLSFCSAFGQLFIYYTINVFGKRN